MLSLPYRAAAKIITPHSTISTVNMATHTDKEEHQLEQQTNQLREKYLLRDYKPQLQPRKQRTRSSNYFNEMY